MRISAEYLNGYRLIASDAVKKRIQRRTHRKKRVNKKWLKKYGYMYVPDDEHIYIMGDCIVGTPKTIEKIIKQYKGGE